MSDVNKGDFTFPRYPELEPHMQFSDMSRTLILCVCADREEIIIVLSKYCVGIQSSYSIHYHLSIYFSLISAHLNVYVCVVCVCVLKSSLSFKYIFNLGSCSWLYVTYS